MIPIYEPKGRAKEYSETKVNGEYSNLAINIYDGCTHGCLYCYAPLVLRKNREEFHKKCSPRKNIVKEVENQLIKENITGKSIFLCFTCDPFPTGISHETTYQIIELIKKYGNSVQILTKGVPDNVKRLIALLDENDTYGISFTSLYQKYEPNIPNFISRSEVLKTLKIACLVNTFISCEPLINTEDVLFIIKYCEYVDLFRIGKLNYPSLIKDESLQKINIEDFKREVEEICGIFDTKCVFKKDLFTERSKK